MHLLGELKQVLEGPEDIEWAEWHSKGNAVLAGSKDGTVWMWMAHNGQCVHVFAGINNYRPTLFICTSHIIIYYMTVFSIVD